MLKIGVNTNNECGENIKEILANIKKAGFENVMVAYKVGRAEESLKIAKDLGLNVPFVHLTNSNVLWAKGDENISLMKNLKEQIEITAKYKIPTAVLHATKGNAEELALPPNQHGLDCIKELVSFAKKLKVKIALENLDKPSYKHFKFVLDNINDENLGFCYDAGHHQLYFPNIDILKKYGNRIIAIHMHDNLMDWIYGYDWTRDLHRLPFDGKINYEKILKKLSLTPYNNVMMLELHKENSVMYENLTDLEFLNEARKRAEKLATMLDGYRQHKK